MSKATGLRRLINAFTYSSQGISSCLRSEAAFRQEALLCILLVPLGLWIGETSAEKALLAGSLLLLLVVEIINTAIERVVDRISSDHHELSKDAKDMGSAAVLITIVFVAMVWALILWDKI